MVRKNYSPGLFPTWWLCDPSSNKLRCETAWPQKGTSQNLDSNPQQPTLKKNTCFFSHGERPANNPKKKQKKHLWESRTKRFQRCKFPCCGTFKAWVTNGTTAGQPPLDHRWIIGGNPHIWMKFHILGHGRADTSTFKSVQLVPAHVDKMIFGH